MRGGAIAEFLGQRAQLVAAEVEALQLAQRADRLGQRAQLVFVRSRRAAGSAGRSPRAAQSAGCR